MSLHSLRSQNSTFILIYFVWLFFLLHILSFSLSLLCLSFFISPGLLHTTLRQTAVFFASYNYSYSLSLSLSFALYYLPITLFLILPVLSGVASGQTKQLLLLVPQSLTVLQLLSQNHETRATLLQ